MVDYRDKQAKTIEDNKVKTDTVLEVGDIEIGAVELKDHDSILRADIFTEGGKNRVGTGSTIHKTDGTPVNPSTEETLLAIKTQTDKLSFDGQKLKTDAVLEGETVKIEDSVGTVINPAKEDGKLNSILTQLDIKGSALRDALRGINTKDFSTVQTAIDLLLTTTAFNTKMNVVSSQFGKDYLYSTLDARSIYDLLKLIKDMDGIKKITDAVDISDKWARLLGKFDLQRVLGSDISISNPLFALIRGSQAQALAQEGTTPYELKISKSREGYSENDGTGTTTNSLTDILDLDLREREKLNINLKNTLGVNTLRYKLVTRAKYGGTINYDEFPEADLAPLAVVSLKLTGDKKYAQVRLRVKSKVADSHTDYKYEYIASPK